MNVRRILPAVFGAVSLLAVPVSFAAPLRVALPVHALFSHEKLVHFDIRNASGAPIELKAGDKIQTIETGKTISLALPEGTRVTTTKASGSYAEGAIVAEVRSPLSGNTVVLH